MGNQNQRPIRISQLLVKGITFSTCASLMQFLLSNKPFAAAIVDALVFIHYCAVKHPLCFLFA